MADSYNFNMFQIPAEGLTGDLGGVGAQQNRAFDVKMSSFGALKFGTRSSSDYTRITNSDAAFVENPTVPPFVMLADYKLNPYVVGSTVKRIWNDEFVVLNLGSRRSNTSTTAPGFDVSDTYAAVDDGTNAPKKFPMEGWRTFGGRTGGPEGYADQI